MGWPWQSMFRYNFFQGRYWIVANFVELRYTVRNRVGGYKERVMEES